MSGKNFNMTDITLQDLVKKTEAILEMAEGMTEDMRRNHQSYREHLEDMHRIEQLRLMREMNDNIRYLRNSREKRNCILF